MHQYTGARRAARHEARARRHDEKQEARSERHAQRGTRRGSHKKGHHGQGAGPCCGAGRRGHGAGRGALVEPAILTALMKGGGHGYDLRKSIAELSDDAMSVDAGGLYRTLRRMEEEGFVTSKWVEGDSGPQKREYDLTAAGHELAEDWIEHLRERATLASMLADELERACAEGAGEGSTDG